MSVGAAVIGFLSALPDIMKLIQQGMTWVNKVSGDDPAGWIKRTAAVMDQLNSAKTQADREAAAGAISKLIQGL